MTETKKEDSPLSNLEPNVTAAFSYLLPPFTGIVFILLESRDKFVRFHAFQSILFGIAYVVIWKMVQLLWFTGLGFKLKPFVSVAGLGLWLMLLWKAYNKEEFELPYIGKIAKDQVYK